MRIFLALTSAFFFFLPTPGYTEAGIPLAITRNMYTKQLDTFYGIANSDLFGAAGGGSLKGVNALAIYNGSSLADVGINTRSQGCGAASGDNFMIPASSGLVIEHVMIGKVICARSLGSSLVVGNLYISVW